MPYHDEKFQTMGAQDDELPERKCRDLSSKHNLSLQLEWSRLKMLFARCYSVQPTRSIAAASLRLAKAKAGISIPSPKELKRGLDEYVIGQDIAKKVLSVAVYNHYLRINDRQARNDLKRQKQLLEEEQAHSSARLNENSEAQAGLKNLENQFKINTANVDESLELNKSNILVVGPTGSGKTLLATTLAKLIDVPIAITDCTQLTQAGYIGEDVEVCIERLLVNADFNVAKAERGIIVLDEIDKLARSTNSSAMKDVSGEGVQQSLLKIIEGHKLEITVKRPIKETHSSKDNHTTSKKEETFVIDTSNVLFMVMGAFVGLDKIISKRIRTLQGHNKAKDVTDTNGDDKNGSKKPFKVDNKIETVDLKNGSIVPALSLTTPSDLVSFGLIPELIGRVPIVTALKPLEKDDLFNILVEPKNALIEQYKYIFNQFGVTLAVTSSALKEVANFALQEGTGARGLRGIMERLLLNVNYECPNSGVSYVLINKDTVNSLRQSEYSLATHVNAKYYGEEEKLDYLNDIQQEDKELYLQLKKQLMPNKVEK